MSRFLKYELAVLLVGTTVSFAAQLAADTHKYAIVVGNNLGHDTNRKLRFAESDAAKMYNVLVEVGSFNIRESRLLLGKSQKQVLKQLARIERLIERDKKVKHKTLLVFYFSGHAEGKVLQLGASSLSYAKLKEHFASSQADVRLGFLDSCRSGQILRSRGGHKGPAFNVNVVDEISSSGFAIVTSSADDEVSQETEEFRGGFFTHFLVSALRGAGDETRDGKITLEEAYRYAYRRTAAQTTANVGGGQHPMYQFHLQGKGEVVLTRPGLATSRLQVAMHKPGRLMLLDANGQYLLAESEMSFENKATFAVRPGAYNVYYVGEKGQVLRAKTNAVAGQTASLARADFRVAKLKRSMERGGLFVESNKPWAHRLGLGGGWRLWGLEPAHSSYGASVHYRARSPVGIEPTARLIWTTRSDTKDSKNYHDFGAQVGLGYAWRVPHLYFRIQALLGMEVLRQSEENSYTTGYTYLGLAGLELPLQRQTYLALDAGLGGRVFQVLGKGVVHRLDAQAMLSVGARFGR